MADFKYSTSMYLDKNYKIDCEGTLETPRIDYWDTETPENRNTKDFSGIVRKYLFEEPAVETPQVTENPGE